MTGVDNMDINELKEEAKRTWFNYGESIKKALGFSGNIEAGPLLRVIEKDDKDTIKEFILQVKELTERMDKIRERFQQ